MDLLLIKKYQKELTKISSDDKDFLIAYLMWLTEKHNKALNRIGKVVAKENPKNAVFKAIKEIEDTISLGIPGWIKYTRKTKKTKS